MRRQLAAPLINERTRRMIERDLERAIKREAAAMATAGGAKDARTITREGDEGAE